MIKNDENAWSECRKSEIGIFIRILVHQFENYSNEIKALYYEFGCFPGLETIDKKFPEYFERSIISTVFLGIFLENLLYDVAVDLKGKSFADRISKRKIEEEFNEICELIQSAPVIEVEAISSDLKSFRKTRNYYVHNKSQNTNHNPKDGLELYTPESAVKFAYKVCRFLNTCYSEYQLARIVCVVLADAYRKARDYDIDL